MLDLQLEGHTEAAEVRVIRAITGCMRIDHVRNQTV